MTPLNFIYNKDGRNYSAICFKHNYKIGIFNVFEGDNSNMICVKVFPCHKCLDEAKNLIVTENVD